MAFTKSLLNKTVHGNERVEHYEVTADAVSGVVVTGMSVVTNAQVSIKSMVTTTAMRMKINTDILSAAANGSIFFSSVVGSGDCFYLTVYGR